MLFSFGRWTVPFAIWISIPLIIRATRYLKWPMAIGVLLPIQFVVNLIVWKNIIPLPSPVYQIVAFITALFFILPLLIDKFLHSRTKGVASILVYPLALVVFQFILHTISPSGTFGSIAYTQNNLYLLQIVSITGIWGIIFLFGIWGSFLNHIYEHYREPKEIRKAIFVFLLLFVLPVSLGVVRLLTGVHHDPYIKVAGIYHEFEFSKSIKDHKKEFDKASLISQNYLLDQTSAVAENGANIVIWQEAALLVRHEKVKHLIDKLSVIAKENHVHICAAMMVVPDDYPSQQSTNEVVWINSVGDKAFEYIKAFPTPAENVISGESVLPLIETEFGNISVAICFDMNFPGYIQQAGKNKTDLLFVPANDWLEITPYHARLAGFRAIENGFNLFRVSGNGYSVAYDCYGRELASFNSFKENCHHLFALIPLGCCKTIYARTGDLFVWVSLFLFLCFGIRSFRVKPE